MGRITVLDDPLINKIAAGEVVERPASVVKELVENSLDANADTVETVIKNGGKDLIRVKDNGIGMNEEDAKLAFKRHSTSKIEEVEDLFHINTFGFRGEALPSIASVARLKLLTKEEDEMLGTELRVENGTIQEVSDAGAPEGTTVEVSDLFYNIPARRKFLKTKRTELNHITKIITKFSLVNPRVSFRLTHDGKELFYYPATDNLMERIKDVYGAKFVDKLIRISYSSQRVSVTGFVSKPNFTKSSKKYQHFYLNSRIIRNKTLNAALLKGYGTLISKGQYPICIIDVNIDPKLVDINVHPAKYEVRFKRGQLVFSAVKKAVKTAFSNLKTDIEEDVKTSSSKRENTSSSTSEDTGKRETQSRESDLSQSAFEDSTPSTGSEEARKEASRKLKNKLIERKSPDKSEKKEEEQSSKAEFPGEETKPQKDYDVVEPPEIEFNQFHDSYIIVEVKDGILLIDQHAAHERILYEKIKEQFDEELTQGQKLLFPTELKLSPSQFQTFVQYKQEIKKLGFDVEEAEENTVEINSIPPFIKEFNDGEVFTDILDEIQNEALDFEDKFRLFLGAAACQLAIKAGTELSRNEMNFLFDKLFETNEPYSCPHGRPTFIKITFNELEKRFGRR